VELALPGPRTTKGYFMATTKDSATAHLSTRVTRGIKLANELDHRITRIFAHTWEVPSYTGLGTYIVRTDRGTCDCPEQDRGCKHQVAVEIVASRRRRQRLSA
jgi:hypothetical protein